MASRGPPSTIGHDTFDELDATGFDNLDPYQQQQYTHFQQSRPPRRRHQRQQSRLSRAPFSPAPSIGTLPSQDADLTDVQYNKATALWDNPDVRAHFRQWLRDEQQDQRHHRRDQLDEDQRHHYRDQLDQDSPLDQDPVQVLQQLLAQQTASPRASPAPYRRPAGPAAGMPPIPNGIGGGRQLPAAARGQRPAHQYHGHPGAAARHPNGAQLPIDGDESSGAETEYPARDDHGPRQRVRRRRNSSYAAHQADRAEIDHAHPDGDDGHHQDLPRDARQQRALTRYETAEAAWKLAADQVAYHTEKLLEWDAERATAVANMMRVKLELEAEGVPLGTNIAGHGPARDPAPNSRRDAGRDAGTGGGGVGGGVGGGASNSAPSGGNSRRVRGRGRGRPRSDSF